MIRQSELFQQDLFEGEATQNSIVSARRTDRTQILLGRCSRCGAHMTNEDGFCADCLGTAYCGCHECMQVASLYRMLQNDLYWAKRNCDTEQVHLIHLAKRAEQMRYMPCCGEVAA